VIGIADHRRLVAVAPWRAGSRAVSVSVRTDESVVVLTVQAFGMGVPREVLDRFSKTGNVGVGLAGIRERLKELEGALEIASNFDGTILKATIPAVSSQETRSTFPPTDSRKKLLPGTDPLSRLE
jgi:signal transduction histidine kinase